MFAEWKRRFGDQVCGVEVGRRLDLARPKTLKRTEGSECDVAEGRGDVSCVLTSISADWANTGNGVEIVFKRLTRRCQGWSTRQAGMI